MKSIDITEHMLLSGHEGTAVRGEHTIIVSPSFVGNGTWFISRKIVTNNRTFRKTKRMRREFPSIKRIIRHDTDLPILKYFPSPEKEATVVSTCWVYTSDMYGPLRLFEPLLGKREDNHALVNKAVADAFRLTGGEGQFAGTGSPLTIRSVKGHVLFAVATHNATIPRFDLLGKVVPGGKGGGNAATVKETRPRGSVRGVKKVVKRLVKLAKPLKRLRRL